ncbi:hypothetical protein [Clostridium caldaquaticum]|nr:hypothetical protein [Clostridium caldaquaticum]
MFRLIKLNVERVVNSENARDNLIKQGYKLVEQQIKKEPKKSSK